MAKLHNKLQSRQPIRRDVVRRLVRECKVMQSRAQAVLNCEDAINHLSAGDVFGGQYPRLLKEDVRSLRRTIELAERELREVVEP
jgi:hypothetical protein